MRITSTVIPTVHAHANARINWTSRQCVRARERNAVLLDLVETTSFEAQARCDGRRHRERACTHEPQSLIFVIFVPSKDRSPIKPFSPKIKPSIGLFSVALSYCPPEPFDTTAKDVSAPTDQS